MLNDAKAWIDHETGGLPSDFWNDVSDAMNSLLGRVDAHYQSYESLHFHELLESEHKQEKVLTFIPLLHLTNERRVNLGQEEHFGHIHIELLDSRPVEEYVEPAA